MTPVNSKKHSGTQHKNTQRRPWSARRRGENMDIFEENPLQDCPYCGGAGLLEEENGKYKELWDAQAKYYVNK